mmetsp:Transcript_35899/g.81116  ORF Transcript_35899/g.81116 Transcript_35899/m.81116 type:complete len:245 (-) Transcript_35899:24-758(-)
MFRWLGISHLEKEVDSAHLFQQRDVVVVVLLELLDALCVVAQVAVLGLAALALRHDGLQLLLLWVGRVKLLWLQAQLRQLALLEALLHPDIVSALVVRQRLQDVVVRADVPILAGVVAQCDDQGAVVDPESQRVHEILVRGEGHPYRVQVEVLAPAGRLRVQDIGEIISYSILLVPRLGVALPLEVHRLVAVLLPLQLERPLQALCHLALKGQVGAELCQLPLQPLAVVLPSALLLPHDSDPPS